MSLFITFEGPDGSGKTTQIQLLAEALGAAGWPVLTTREPGGTRIGNAIRNLLMDVDHAEMRPRTETLLFNAARAQIVDEVIRPALDAGKIVLCDRYADSTLAYQGCGHEQSLDELRALIRYATGGLTPHLTIYLDVTPEVGLARRRQDADLEWTRLDAQALAFHRRVRAGYRRLIAEEPERWVSIDADRSPEDVHGEILRTVKARLKTKVEEHA